MLLEAWSSQVRPVLRGERGAIAAAHPLAVAAGQQMFAAGGTACDAAIAAQAVLCVLMPDACGIGGDLLALVRRPGQPVQALHGAGTAPAAQRTASDDGASSITVPGIVDAWCRMSALSGSLPLSQVLAPAIQLARSGMRVSTALADALMRQAPRLERGGASNWALFGKGAGSRVNQPELAALLEAIGQQGRSAFYDGKAAQAIARTISALGGCLSQQDLAAHATTISVPVQVEWGDWRVLVQPPMTQGVLLAMAVQAWDRMGPTESALQDHIGIELTQAAFAFRDEVARGGALLQEPLALDLNRASGRGGPRAYLHTAGVAAADREGHVVSSLVSVFDDFGSAVFVPELGITLNNRAAGFTQGANAVAPGRFPVHTLAPAMLETPRGMLALSTPGADGQVQTLLQVLAALRLQGADLASAIARPRWRSENGRLLVERTHEAQVSLQASGHQLVPLPDGDARFGAVVCAGVMDGDPVAASDWRRETAAGVA